MNEYPLSAALGLKLVRISTGKHFTDGQWHEQYVEHPGFDHDDVLAKLGDAKFAKLSSSVKSVFSVGHRNWPADHNELAKRKAEVHCFYAADVENFLKEQS